MLELLNGWLALGAIGGAIPVIIHLLNRRRFKVTRWAAMEFLLASLKKNFKRIRMQNLLLLLLRVLLIVLIALALARPKLTESGVLSALGTEDRHAILVLDDSFSMGYRAGTKTCFETAQEDALQILGSLHQGDVVSLLAMSDVTTPVIKEATLDIPLVEREIKRLRPGHGGTDVARALVAAADLLDATRKPRKEIYLLTDLQARGWTRGPKESAELAAAIGRINKDAKLFVMDVGADEPENLAVIRLRSLSNILGAGSPAEFEVEVANFGRTKKSGVQVRFLVDKFNQDSAALEIPAGGTAAASFTHLFRNKGAHVVQAELDTDALKADNVRHLAALVDESVPVLLVNGEPSPERFQGETDFLETALKPPVSQPGLKVSTLDPKTITEFAVSGTDFGRYRVVVLANLASMDAASAVPRLEDYVRQGGSLLVFPGDRVDRAFYNQQLYKGGKGLLPAELGPERGSTGDDKKPVHIELQKPAYPPFAFFTGEKAHFITDSVLFYKYFELKPPKDAGEDLREIARFVGGGPAIIEKTFGRGRVVLFASSADTEWNNFAQSAAYVYVMQELMNHLASNDIERRNVIVHDAYRQVFAPEELVDAVSVRPPGEGAAETKLRPHAAAPAPDGRTQEVSPVTEIEYADTDAAGPYELRFERKDGVERPMEYFAVNVPSDESDVARLTREKAQAAFKGLKFEYARNVAELKLAVRESRAGRDFARALLLAVLALACIELVLGQRFGK